MRVIAEEYKKKCQHCNSQLAFLPEDVKDDEMSGTYVICPICGKFVQLTRSELPKNWIPLIKWED